MDGCVCRASYSSSNSNAAEGKTPPPHQKNLLGYVQNDVIL